MVTTTVHTPSASGIAAAASEHGKRLTARETVLANLGSTPSTPTPIHASRLHQKIAGLQTRAYDTTVNGDPVRLWYTDQLPKPPRDAREQLLALSATSSTPQQGRRDDHDCDHDDEYQALGAADFVGRVLLRSETKKSGVWKVTLDTTTAARSTILPSEFELPPGFSSGPDAATPAAATPAKAPGLALLQPALAEAQPSAFAIYLGGPQLRRPEVHAIYWGASFADPAHAPAVAELDNAIATAVGDTNFAAMGQYGTAPGRLASSHIVGLKPPEAVLTDFISLFATAAFVEASMIDFGPLFWWKAGPDPMFLVVVNSDEVGGNPSWGGYHLDTPSPTFLLPFPINLFTNDFMPFALATTTRAALELPSGALAGRDHCATNGTCNSIAAFDSATQIASHEIYEAVVDPYPFSGWTDPLHEPIWTKGELADLCEDRPFNQTRVGDYSLATFWSNEAHDCVGNYRSSVRLLAPMGTVPWSSSLTFVQAQAEASAAIYRGAELERNISWQVDGIWRGSGSSLKIYGLAAGPHHVTVTVTDANGFVATDESDIVLQRDCAASFGTSCGSCGGVVQCDGSCTIPTPADYGTACGSCGGTVQCDSSCNVQTPADLGQSCGCGGAVQCDGSCSSSCGLVAGFSDVDDEAYVWLYGPGFDSNPASSICQINQGGTPRSGQCDLGAWMQASGLQTAQLIVKIGNGGCFESHGNMSFSMNGNEVWSARKGNTGPFTHCGWTYRVVLDVDLRAGTVTPSAIANNPNSCITVFDCPF